MTKEQFNDCAAAIIVFPDGRFLLQHRTETPGIEFPGFWALIAGRLLDHEEPEAGLRRELLEELETDEGSPVAIARPKFISGEMRSDRPWREFVFSVALLTAPISVRIKEGQGFGLFSGTEILGMTKIAPHHKKYLESFIKGNITKGKSG